MASPITITGTLIDLSGGLIQSGTVVFTLQNYGGQLPTVTGTGEIIGLQVTAVSNGSGVFSVQLFGNDVINPGPNITYYSVVFKDNSGINPIANIYQFFGAGPIDLTSYQPITSVPSTPILSPVVTNPTAIQTIQTFPLQIQSLQIGTASDTGFSRLAAGSLALGNGTASDASGKLSLHDLTLSGGVLDATTASHTLPVLKGTIAAKPATATVGELYFATDAAAGVNLFFATATNTWSQMSATGTYTPAGANKQLQYNNNGVAAGSAQLSFDNAAGNTTLQATAAATSGTNPTAPTLKVGTNYWTGAASASDLWNVQDVLGATGANPASTLAITHAGSTGTASVNVPILQLGDGSAFTDTGISRDAAGVFDFGNGTQGNTSGTLKATVYRFAAFNSGLSSSGSGVVMAGNGVSGDTGADFVANRFFTGSASTPTIIAGNSLIGSSNSALIFTSTNALGTQDTALYRSSAASISIGNSFSDLSGSLNLTNLNLQTTGVIKWSTDVGLSRDSANVIDVGNGSQGDKTGSLVGARFITDSFTTGAIAIKSPSILMANTSGLVWTNNGNYLGTQDTGIFRTSAGNLALGNGSFGDKTANLAFNLIAGYDGVVPVDKGVAYLVASTHQRGKTAAIGSTSLIASPTSGLYRVMVTSRTTTTQVGTGILTVNITYNDGVVAQTNGSTSIDLTVAGTSGGSTMFGDAHHAVFLIYVNAGTALAYNTTLTSGSITTGVYDLDIFAERLS